MATKALRTVENDLDERGSIDVAMAAAFAEIEAVAKDKVNPHFKSKYADLGSVIESVRPILAAHQLYFIQCCEPSEDGVTIATYVRHISGSQIDFGKLYVPANKRDAQGFGSALTYARRYALVTAFGVPTEDDDGNAAASSNRIANDRPTTGEPKPRERVKYEGGPYTCPTQLMTAARQFVHTLNGLGDYAEYLAWAKTRDVRDFIKQLRKEMPDWWSGGPTCPEEFVPLEILAGQKERDLQALDEIKTREAAA